MGLRRPDDLEFATQRPTCTTLEPSTRQVWGSQQGVYDVETRRDVLSGRGEEVVHGAGNMA